MYKVNFFSVTEIVRSEEGEYINTFLCPAEAKKPNWTSRKLLPNNCIHIYRDRMKETQRTPIGMDSNDYVFECLERVWTNTDSVSQHPRAEPTFCQNAPLSSDLKPIHTVY